MHSEDRNKLIKEQLERILITKARQSGIAMTSDGHIDPKILNEWIDKNQDNIKKWHLEAKAIVTKL